MPRTGRLDVSAAANRLGKLALERIDLNVCSSLAGKIARGRTYVARS